MRTTLFLSSLFAATLVTGAALAEKPAAAPAKAPRAIERLRVHGETVDKVYRGSSSTHAAPQAGQAASTPRTDPAANPRDRVQSKILCSEEGTDCAVARARGNENANGAAAPAAQRADHGARVPAFMDKVLGSDRMVCNEADECMMSTRAANRAWSRAASGGPGQSAAEAAAAKNHEAVVDKVRTQRSEATARMACNEAGECMMSSKAAKKIWAYESVKQGTFRGPDAPAATPAQKAIEAAKKSEKKN